MATSSDDMKGLTFRRFEDGEHRWQSWAEQIFQSSFTHKCPTYVHRTPPCQGSCPAGEDIRGWLDIVRGLEQPPEGMGWQEYAFRRLTTANPFPSIMGRVCPAPCETGCNRNDVEGYVGINSVEQFIGDTAIGEKLGYEAPGEDTGKRVAIIGGGPAGLAAALQLRRRGHACAIFDEHAELGGMMRYGIPSYRTPRDVLDAEIQRILDMGVETRLDTRVGQDVPMADVEKEFDAVLWAVGTQAARPLPIPGADASNVVSALGFLRAFNEGRLRHVPKRVVVVGGGDTSIDVVSVSRRLGFNPDATDRAETVAGDITTSHAPGTQGVEHAEVTLTSVFPREQMTAQDREVEDAIHEGVSVRTGIMPLEVVLDEQGRARALKMAECHVEKDMTMVPHEGTEFELEADLIVEAIGQTGALDGLDELNNGRNLIDADGHYQVKGREGHFVAGDAVRPHLLTTAIGQAWVAAESIDHYLKHRGLVKRPKVDKHHFDLLNKLRETGLGPDPYDHQQVWGTSESRFAVHNYEDRSKNEIIKTDHMWLGYFNYTPRINRETIHIGADEVLGDFRERLVALGEEQAVEEAKRCMSCGLCFECDQCVIYCPQDAVHRVPKGERTTGRYVYTDYTRCIGCHICADVCPTGYIDMALGE